MSSEDSNSVKNQSYVGVLVEYQRLLNAAKEIRRRLHELCVYIQKQIDSIDAVDPESPNTDIHPQHDDDQK